MQVFRQVLKAVMRYLPDSIDIKTGSRPAGGNVLPPPTGRGR